MGTVRSGTSIIPIGKLPKVVCFPAQIEIFTESKNSNRTNNPRKDSNIFVVLSFTSNGKMKLFTVALILCFQADSLLGRGYYQGVPGGVCNDVKDVIRMKQICLEAIEKLNGVTDSRNTWMGKNGGWVNIPQGCSIRDGGDLRPHFERSGDGLGTGRKDLIPICQNHVFRYSWE